MNSKESGIISLVDRSIIIVSGIQAAEFLNAMCTNDIKNLTSGRLMPAAFCTPQGKVISSFFIWRHEEVYYLLLPLVMTDKVYHWLKNHRLQSQVEIEVDQERHCTALIGSSQHEHVTLIKVQEPMRVTYQKRGDLFVLDFLEGKFLLVGNREVLNNYVAELHKRQIDDYPYGYWNWLALMSGWALITEESTGKYTPQEMNLDLMTAIDFNKGCFPGQDTIRQIHNIRESKRMLLYGGGQTVRLSPGSPVYFEGKVVGEIVSSALSPEGQVNMLVLVPITGIDLSRLSNGFGPLGPCLGLPYAVFESTLSEN